ncbi:YgcG family protein [Flavobacterium sp. ASW18X]|uniref:TPM domain-containing protein n=1 Tax=Flavobacterium sp. ASW18X TaxID=2572595 RepID=UPI0010ADDCA5|nr:TPM domain-containing protein [Flavobacterium sp. ASW18X]TKD66185.1 TPM domain-containing protein [Flavobacterium sp. ASW18X]
MIKFKTQFFSLGVLFFFISCVFSQKETSVKVLKDSILKSLEIEVAQPDSLSINFDGATNSEILNYPEFIAPNYGMPKSIYTVTEVPSPRGTGIFGYVSDPLDYISETEERYLNQELYHLEQETTAEVTIVFLPSIGNEIPKEFAVSLFNTWKIGKEKTDNGLLILTVMDQRRTEFEVGYGLEPYLTDAICYRIGTQEIVPLFRNGYFGLGLMRATDRITEIIRHPESVQEIYDTNTSIQSTSSVSKKWIIPLLISYLIISILLALYFYTKAYTIHNSQDDYYDKYLRLDDAKAGCLQFLFPLPLFFYHRMAKRRLAHYRKAPRYSKVNGKPMVLLNNYDEIDFLEKHQLVEEEIQSQDYDVWIVKDHSDIRILKYPGKAYTKYSNCKKCSFRTFGLDRTDYISAATYSSDGLKVEHYLCKNCNYTEEKEIIIPQKQESNSSSSSSSFSSSSSSSSSFGGGSSGGGGAGVSW